jgi:hypothetical protein
MLRQEDLDAAVAEEIVTKAQAQALADFAAKRELGHEERFRFMRGFNDFFFATGVVMLGAGMMYFAGPGSGGNLAAAVVVWGLAELLVRRMRLVLPGLLLACFFVAFAFGAIPADLWNLAPFDPNRLLYTDFRPGFHGLSAPPAAVAVKALAAGAAASLFYARFRLPFALLLIAGSAVTAIAALAVGMVGSAMEPLVLLLSGLGVFLTAMSFDMSDRERLTRRADCAFWLHLLAAPLIVHSLISMIVPSVGAFNMTTMTVAAALAIVAVATLLALVAVVIDRRALLVSTFGYLGIVIAYAITTARVTAPSDPSTVFFSALAVLGILVLVLGVGWQPLRRTLMSLLPTFAVNRLPPAVQAA